MARARRGQVALLLRADPTRPCSHSLARRCRREVGQRRRLLRELLGAWADAPGPGGGAVPSRALLPRRAGALPGDLVLEAALGVPRRWRALAPPRLEARPAPRGAGLGPAAVALACAGAAARGVAGGVSAALRRGVTHLAG